VPMMLVVAITPELNGLNSVLQTAKLRSNFNALSILRQPHHVNNYPLGPGQSRCARPRLLGQRKGLLPAAERASNGSQRTAGAIPQDQVRAANQSGGANAYGTNETATAHLYIKLPTSQVN